MAIDDRHIGLVLFAIGIEAFGRRDIGVTTAVPTPSLPDAVAGLRGPAGRIPDGP